MKIKPLDCNLNELKQEKVLRINSVCDLNLWEPCFTRIYFGSEFCEHLIPDIDDIKNIKSFADEHNIGFTLITPPVTEKGIACLKKIADFFLTLSNKKQIEIVFNDWGALSIFENLNTKFLLGRLLIRQIGDPYAAQYKSKISLEEFSFINALKINQGTLDLLKLKNMGLHRFLWVGEAG